MWLTMNSDITSLKVAEAVNIDNLKILINVELKHL